LFEVGDELVGGIDDDGAEERRCDENLIWAQLEACQTGRRTPQFSPISRP
jgi:hypothetical protein